MPLIDPGQAAFRAAFTNAAGVAPLQSAGAWKDIDFLSEDLTDEYSIKESASIRGNSQRRVGSGNKIAVGGTVEVEMNTDLHYLFLCSLQRATDGGSASGSATIHTLAPKETDTTFNSLCLDIDRNDGNPQYLTDLLVSQWNLSLAINQWVKSTFELVGRRADHWNDPDQDTGTPTITSLRLRGLPKYSPWSGGSMTELAFQVDASDATVLKAVYSNGTPSFVGSTTFTITVDTWTEVVLTDGTKAGTEDIPIEIYVPSGALSTSDVFSFNFARDSWTPDFSSLPASLDEIYITISVDGAEECIAGVDLTAVQPIRVGPCLGGRYPNSIARLGNRSITGTINRDYVDVAFMKRLKRAQTFALRIEMKNGELVPSGGANEQYEIEAYMPKCLLGGRPKTISGPEDVEESLTFTAYEDPDESNGDTDDLTIWLTNGDSDLTD